MSMAFAEEEIEDGMGLATALVYEDVDDAAAWLVRRGLTSFANLTNETGDPKRDRALLLATEEAENAIRPHVRCWPRQLGQHLIFPAEGVYDSRGRLLDAILPEGEYLLEEYLQGIRLLAEASAAGRLMPLRGSNATLQSLSSRSGSASFRAGVDLNSLSTNHPEAWRLISTMIPAL